MPESTLKWQAFNQKKPYLIATVLSLVAGVLAIGFLFDKLADVKKDQESQVKPKAEEAQRKSDQFQGIMKNLQKTQKDTGQMMDWVEDRHYWGDVLAEVRQILVRVEDVTRNKFRTETGVWIETFNTSNPSETGAKGPEAPGQPPPPTPPPDEEGASPRPHRPSAAMRGGSGASGAVANEIGAMSITFRAVSWKSVSPEANKETAYDVLSEMKSSPLFDPDDKATHFVGEIGEEESPGTFTFRIFARLKKPLKL
jgi:hypothetical protein